jgi:hypothetical protein
MIFSAITTGASIFDKFRFHRAYLMSKIEAPAVIEIKNADFYDL